MGMEEGDVLLLKAGWKDDGESYVVMNKKYLTPAK
jgi:hypothetical protein